MKEDLEIALAEIGPIEPWWSEDNGMYWFEHDAYPYVMHGDPDIEKTKLGYMRALKGFIKDRLTGNLDETVDRISSGRGGVRSGSGRPVGTTKAPTKLVRLPVQVADWIKADPVHLEQIKRLMAS